MVLSVVWIIQRGVLAGNITISFTHLVLGINMSQKALSSFMIAYPDITVKLTLTDREVDLVERESILKFVLK